MKIPFFNLKGKPEIEKEKLSDVHDTILNLLKISEDNGKKVKKLILSEAAYRSLPLYTVRKGKKTYIYDLEVQIIPDVAVIWEK